MNRTGVLNSVDFDELTALCARVGVSPPLEQLKHHAPYLVAKWNACAAKLRPLSRPKLSEHASSRPFLSRGFSTPRTIDRQSLAANDY